MVDKEAIADAIDINAIIRKAVREAEKGANLSPVLLRRDSFAGAAVSTGCLCLDKIMGGGIPGGRVIGISGPERSGKTLLATQIGANQVSEYRFLNYMDAEGSTDPIFLAARGINFDKYRGKRNKADELKPGEVDYINFYQPSTVEQIANYIHIFSNMVPEDRNPERPFCIYVLDSVVALITDDIDGNIIDANKMAMHARAYATYLPIINSDLVKSGSTLVYTNQLRQKPMASKYETNIYEPAGDALKFFASARMMLNPTKPKLGDDDHPFVHKDKGVIPQAAPREGGVWEEPHWDSSGNIIGLDRYVYTGIKTVKNKLFTPFQKCWMRIQFEENGSTGHGLDPVFDIFTFLHEEGYIAPSKNDKGKNVKGRFDVYSCDRFDPVKELDMPNEFDYFEFKKWVGDNPGLTAKIREKLLVSGIVYEKEETAMIDENVKREAEEMGELVEQVEAGNVEEVVEKKGRGRPKKS
jgi:RecA/RadA recombinase